MKKLITVLPAAVLLSACATTLDAPQHDPEERPGDTDADAAIVADDRPRYEGPELTLIFGQPGVLMKTYSSSALTGFYDIDGNRRAETEITDEAKRLTVNGDEIRFDNQKILKETDSRLWLRLTDSDGERHLLVVPR